MECLDGDGAQRGRDLVQFVSFNDVNRMMMTNNTGSFASAHELLAAEVLAELPKQVEKYYQNAGLSHKSLVRRLNALEYPRFVNSHVGQQNVQPQGFQQYMNFNQQFNNMNLHNY